uniref:Reverse transcriptase domain-containing protein n=1 Tax=Tanacetum cinerariifolium TaxID=118510 RepID=A0A6L2NRH9_TANCI|nr:reverse transcriptase domain-containing protein [Tanacetum cinerariifolium]
MNTASSSGSGLLPSNTVPNPREDLKAITTWSGVTLARPSVSPSPPPSKEVDREPKTIMDQVLTGSTNNVPPPVVQSSPAFTSSTPISSPKIPKSNPHQPSVAQTQVPIDEPVVAPTPKPTIPYPSRVNKQKLREKDDNLALKFVEIFKNLNFELSFAYALLHMPKFALMFKSLLNKKEKLYDLATTPMNENCSAVILKKLPEKLRDPGKFLISCDFPKLDECLALEDLDRSTTRLAGIAEVVFVKVGKLHFLMDFVVVDYVVDPRVPLILERPFLRTGQALIYVYACEEYVQEVLGFSDNSISGSPTLTSDPIISSSSPSFTPFEGSDFILEEIKTFLRTLDELSNLDDDYYHTKGDILYLEKLLNEDPSPNLPPVKTEDHKQVDATMTKPSIEEPPELELNELPSHFEHAFLEGTDKLAVIIFKEIKDEEKSFLLKVLKSRKWAIAWKISDIKGAVLGQRKTKHFQPIHYESKTMTDAQAHYTTTEKELLAVVFFYFKNLMSLFVIKKGAKNLAADHFSRSENPHQDVLKKKEITKTFPLETVGMIPFCGDSSTPWFADFVNYHAGNFIVKGMSSQQKKKFFKDVKHYFWDDPYLS